MAGDRIPTTADNPVRPQDHSNEASGWLTDNVLHPLINGTGVRQVVDTFTGDEYKPLYQAEPKGIVDTSVQTVSSVIGSIAPYIALGKLTHKGLGNLAEEKEIGGLAGKLLKNEAVANIGAAGAYEFLKKPTDGQTRIGNTAGTMLSFSAYEAGGYALGKITPQIESKIARVAVVGTGRAVIGAAGGEVAYDSSNLIAAHTGGQNQATNSGRMEAMLSGAVLNEALPVVHQGLTKALDISSRVASRTGSAEKPSNIRLYRLDAQSARVELSPAEVVARSTAGSPVAPETARETTPGVRAKAPTAFDAFGKTIGRWKDVASNLIRGNELKTGYAFGSNEGISADGAIKTAETALARGGKDGAATLPKVEITDQTKVAPRALDAHLGVPEVGATFTPDGINFGLRSPGATSVELLIYSTPDAKEPSQVLDMNRSGDIWHRAEQLPEYTAYQYRVTGPHTPDVDGTRFDNSYRLLDPEARAVFNADIGDAKASDARAIAVRDNTFNWDGVTKPNTDPSDTIIYELNVKGYTGGDASLGNLRGTYRGLIEKIPYLKELGVTAIELMPVMEFQKDMKINPETGKMLINAWGYNTVGFKAVEGRYSHDGTTGQQVNEFKEMVREMHRNDIEVIMDVVFNHTGEGGADGKTINFKGLNNNEMYMLDKDNKYSYVDHTGCGNTVNANDPNVQEFIVKSLRYWVQEMQVDGFRFDLAKALKYMPDGSFNDTAPLIEAIRNDPVLSNVKLIAEPWDMSGYGPGRFARGWAEWNGKYRDVVRRFVKGLTGQVKDLGDLLAGSYNAGFDPEQGMRSINFLAVHDGMTMNDLVTYNEKHNESNGENNRDGTNDNDSSNYGVEGPVEKGSPIDVLRERQIKNFFSWLFTSEGTPLMLAGDEMRRTVDGNNNAYNQDDLNQVDWTQLEKNPGVFNFARKSIAMYKDLKIGHMRHDDIIWHGVEPNKPDWSDGSRFIAREYKPVGDANKKLYVAANAWEGPIDIQLPAGTWRRVVDTNLPEFQDIKGLNDGDMMDSPNYRIMPYTTVAFVQDVPPGTARPIIRTSNIRLGMPVPLQKIQGVSGADGSDIELTGTVAPGSGTANH